MSGTVCSARLKSLLFPSSLHSRGKRVGDRGSEKVGGKLCLSHIVGRKRSSRPWAPGWACLCYTDSNSMEDQERMKIREIILHTYPIP